MGYPKKYVGNYLHLASWLTSLGHIVYPYEMSCNPVAVKKKVPKWMKRSYEEGRYETHYLYGYVDVVSRFQSNLWAWEYKSKNDNILRALKQAKNYARSFDYVSVVVADLANFDRYVRSKGLYVKNILRNLGVGMCWNNEGKIEVIYNPILQTPEVKLNMDLKNRFERYCRVLYGKPYHKEQLTKITQFIMKD